MERHAAPPNRSTSPACDSKTGGAGALFRFRPAAANSFSPVGGRGTLTRLPPVTPLPVGNGGAVFSTDVTSQAIAALNDQFAGMRWMIASIFERPLVGPVTNAVDCRTSDDLQLRLTHF